MNRGYRWEAAVRDELNSNGWRALRLGGTTVTIPDIIAVHDKTICGIECKSKEKSFAYIPYEQVLRCYSICETFALYEGRCVFACRFGLGRDAIKVMVSPKVKPRGMVRCSPDMIQERLDTWVDLPCDTVRFTPRGLELHGE